jgi:hypothetical protein
MAGWLELFQGNLDQARARAKLMELTMFPNHPYDVASNLALKAWIGVVSGDAASMSLEQLNCSTRLDHRCNGPVNGIRFTGLMHTWAIVIAP